MLLKHESPGCACLCFRAFFGLWTSPKELLDFDLPAMGVLQAKLHLADRHAYTVYVSARSSVKSVASE